MNAVDLFNKLFRVGQLIQYTPNLDEPAKCSRHAIRSKASTLPNGDAVVWLTGVDYAVSLRFLSALPIMPAENVIGTKPLARPTMKRPAKKSKRKKLPVSGRFDDKLTRALRN